MCSPGSQISLLWLVLKFHFLFSRAAIGVDEGQEGVGEVERWRGEGERVKREMIEELSRLQRRKLELLTQLSSLGPSPVVMEILHRLEESAREVDQQISGWLDRCSWLITSCGDGSRWLCSARTTETGSDRGTVGGCL